MCVTWRDVTCLTMGVLGRCSSAKTWPRRLLSVVWTPPIPSWRFRDKYTKLKGELLTSSKQELLALRRAATFRKGCYLYKGYMENRSRTYCWILFRGLTWCVALTLALLLCMSRFRGFSIIVTSVSELKYVQLVWRDPLILPQPTLVLFHDEYGRCFVGKGSRTVSLRSQNNVHKTSSERYLAHAGALDIPTCFSINKVCCSIQNFVYLKGFDKVCLQGTYRTWQRLGNAYSAEVSSFIHCAPLPDFVF